MIKISKQLTFFLKLARVQAIVARSFDRSLGVGIGFTDFVILYYLSQAPDEKMRRIDLADKVALSASGITRLLLPMEKIGLVKREASSSDARVSYVKLAPGGKRLLQESLEKAELISAEFLPETKIKKMDDVSDLFSHLSMGQIID
jgi:DNA-binding MarR family transcriptional regulator